MWKVFLCLFFSLVCFSCNVKNHQIIVINKNELNLGLLEIDEIKVLALPHGYVKEELIWSSLNQEVAVVTNGEVTGLSQGKTKIIVSTINKKAMAEIDINVNSKPYSISLNSFPEKLEKKVAPNSYENTKDFKKITLATNFNVLKNPQLRLYLYYDSENLIILTKGLNETYHNLKDSEFYVFSGLEFMSYQVDIYILAQKAGDYIIDFELVNTNSFPYVINSKESITLNVYE